MHLIYKRYGILNTVITGKYIYICNYKLSLVFGDVW